MVKKKRILFIVLKLLLIECWPPEWRTCAVREKTHWTWVMGVHPQCVLGAFTPALTAVHLWSDHPRCRKMPGVNGLIDFNSSPCSLHQNTGLIWPSDCVGESQRVSGVPLCGICCSQALWGAQSLQHYGMQSQKSPKLCSFAQGDWVQDSCWKEPYWPLPVSIQCSAAGEFGGALFRISCELVPEIFIFNEHWILVVLNLDLILLVSQFDGILFFMEVQGSFKQMNSWSTYCDSLWKVIFLFCALMFFCFFTDYELNQVDCIIYFCIISFLS